MAKWLLVLLVACGGASADARLAHTSAPVNVAANAGASAGPTTATQEIPEQLVIEGTVSVEVDEVRDLVPALRAQVDNLGGRVITEVVEGAAESWHAHLRLRLPPAKVEEVVTFLAAHGDITSKNISATDVSKQLFDQELAIKNLKTTLDRLAKLMETPGLTVDQVLKIEQEMTRVRGQIEQLEGDQRFLKDRVALATLEVSITRREGAVTVAKAKVYPGGRIAMLTLFDAGARKGTRLGGGIVIHSLLRSMSFEADLFQKELDAMGKTSSAAVIATVGGAAYSDFLGGGTRAYGNPYLGFRLGYAYLDASRFAVQGEAGVELYKNKYLVVDASVRATGLFGNDTDVALVSALGATVAF